MRKRLKPVYISLLVILIFAGAMYLGRHSEWWITEGRKTPFDTGGGHDDETEIIDEHTIETTEDEHTDEEEDHETNVISGSSTVQSALDLGITMEELELVLEGELTDTSAKIQDIVTERGLKFGVVKDALNAYLTD